MSASKVRVRNTHTGQVGEVSERLFNHPVFGKWLVAAEHDDKPYVPELYKSRTPEEFLADKSPEQNDTAEKDVDASEAPKEG